MLLMKLCFEMIEKEVKQRGIYSSCFDLIIHV